MQWPTVEMLKNEYNMGWLDDEGLAQYIGLGLLSTNQFNAITGKGSSESNASNGSMASNQATSSNSNAPTQQE